MRPDDPGADPSIGGRSRPGTLWSWDDGWTPAGERDSNPATPPPAPRRSGESARNRGTSPGPPAGRRRTRTSGAPPTPPSAPPLPEPLADPSPTAPSRPRRPPSEDAPGDPESVARAICLRLLTLQPRTRAELATALTKRGVPDDAATTVLSRFTEVGLIDDRAFAAAWVDSRHAGRGLSRRALAAELRRRGVDGEIVGAAVAVVDAEAEERAARQLVDRRLAATRRLDRPARIRRLAGMLARKGYPGGLAMRVVREALAAEGTDPDDPDDLDGWDDPPTAD